VWCSNLSHCLTDQDPLFVQLGQWEECSVAGQPDCIAYQWNPDTGEPTAWHRWLDGDYHLQAGSPAIDAGTSEGAPATDIEGHGRPCGKGVDIGAYEFGRCPANFPKFIRGDANSDNQINIADAIHTLSYLLVHGAAASCRDAADANDDGRINIADAIAVLAHIFANAGPLPQPFGACGIDATIDELDCTEYVHCQ